MRDALTAIGPAFFALLGTILGGLITYRATVSQKRTDQDNEARDAVLQMLLTLSRGTGHYERGEAGETGYGVPSPSEPAATLFDRFRSLQAVLLAAGFSWEVMEAALRSAWEYVDLVRQREGSEEDHLPEVDRALDQAAARALRALSELVKALERPRSYRRSWRLGRDFGLRLGDQHAWFRRVRTTLDWLRSSDSRADSAFRRGSAAWESQQWRRAERIWRRVARTRSSPSAGLAAASVGEILHRRGDLAGAEKALRRALERWQTKPEYSWMGWGESLPAQLLGEVLAESQNLEGAAEAFRRAKDAAAQNPYWTAVAAISLALVQRERGDLAGACSCLREAVDTAVEPFAAGAAMELAALLTEQGDVGGALAAYKKAQDGPPMIADAATQGMSVYSATGQLPPRQHMSFGDWPPHQGLLPTALPPPFAVAA